MLNFQFIEYFFALLLLIPVIWAFWYSKKKKQKITKLFGNDIFYKKLSPLYSSKKYSVKFFLLAAALFFLIIALSNPRIAGGKKEVLRNGIDIIFALDVSNSMLAADVNPSRLERAKQVIYSLINKLGNDRIGIIIFAGKAYMQMPLSSDHSVVPMFLNSATPQSVPTQGTDISSALKMCNVSFSDDEKSYKSVIILSDGEEQDENAVKQAGLMSESGIVINTVGFGSLQGATIPEPEGGIKTDENGDPVISKYNRATMLQIAKAGNGIFMDYTTNNNVVESLYSELTNLDKKEIKDETLIDYTSIFQIFILLSFLLVVIEIITGEKKRKFKKAVSLATLFFVCNSTIAQSSNELLVSGNNEYKTGNYQKAADYYLKASVNNDDYIPDFNLSTALFRLNKTDEALKALNSALKKAKTNADLSDIHYNIGVIYQNNNKLAECIVAYKNALILNPDNEDARQNLQKALRKQKQNDYENKKKEKNEANQNKSRSSKITKEDAENKLQALQQQEKNIRGKINKKSGTEGSKPVKDW